MQESKVYRHKKTEEGVKATFITEPKTYRIDVNMFVASEAGHYLVDWEQGCITPIKQDVFEDVFEEVSVKQGWEKLWDTPARPITPIPNSC